MSSFRYDSVPFNAKDQIRLFSFSAPSQANLIKPSEHSISIEGSLKSVDIATATNYIALSYTWGDASSLKTILIDNQPFDVTGNLHEALFELQNESSLGVWIDAICINQSDNAEKSIQVARMRDIYKAATMVFAWLGPGDVESDIGMDELKRIGDLSIGAGMQDLTREVMLKLWDPDLAGLLDSVRDPFVSLSKDLGVEFPQLAIHSITERSYWQRTWIAQEFSVATVLVIACGSKRLDYDRLWPAIMFLGMHATLVGRSITKETRDDPVKGPALKRYIKIQAERSGHIATGSMTGCRRIFQRKPPARQSSLMEYLGHFTGSLKVTDPRDSIYGIRGLAADVDVLNIDVNYDKQTHEVYTETARALLRQNHTDILSWCSTPKAVPGLPSWVPDFSSKLRDPIGSYKSKPPSWTPLFNASRSHEVKISVSPTEKTDSITLSGLSLDTIKELGEPWEKATGDNFWEPTTKFLYKILEFVNAAQKLENPISRDSSFWEEAFWRTPCADQELISYYRRRAVITGEVTAEAGCCEVIARMRFDLSGYSDTARNEAFKKYDGAMGYLYGLRPFISEKGYVGLAPEDSKPGDVVCVIIGAIVPYVLRKLNAQEFRLVGEAYVHWVMDGEALDLGLDEVEFCLR